MHPTVQHLWRLIIVNNTQPIRKRVVAGLLGLALLTPLQTSADSIFRHSGAPPTCPETSDILAGHPRFDAATLRGNGTYSARTKATFGFGTTDRRWSLWTGGIKAADKQEALEKANQLLSGSWDRLREKAGDLGLFWSCTYHVDGVNRVFVDSWP